MCHCEGKKNLQQRIFFLRKLSILSFGLICVIGNMRAQDQDKLQRMIKMARRVIGCDQLSAAQMWKDLILSKADRILSDSTHPLHNT